MANIRCIFTKYKEIVNYIFFGILTTLISLLIYYGCVILFLNPKNAIQLQMANIISWIGSVTFAFITNRKYVFESANKSIIKEMLVFFSSRVLTLLLDMGGMFLLVTVWALNDKIVKVFIQGFVIIGNYILSKFFVFRKNDKI